MTFFMCRALQQLALPNNETADWICPSLWKISAAFQPLRCKPPAIPLLLHSIAKKQSTLSQIASAVTLRSTVNPP